MVTYEPLFSLWDVDGQEIKDWVIPFGYVQRGGASDDVELTIWNNRMTTKMYNDPARAKLSVSWPDALNVKIQAVNVDGTPNDRFLVEGWMSVKVYNKTSGTWPTVYQTVYDKTLIADTIKGSAYKYQVSGVNHSQDNNWCKIRIKLFIPPDAPQGENFNFRIKLTYDVGPTDPASPEAIAAGYNNYENM